MAHGIADLAWRNVSAVQRERQVQRKTKCSSRFFGQFEFKHVVFDSPTPERLVARCSIGGGQRVPLVAALVLRENEAPPGPVWLFCEAVDVDGTVARCASAPNPHSQSLVARYAASGTARARVSASPRPLHPRPPWASR
jgi:hypothetical protein